MSDRAAELRRKQLLARQRAAQLGFPDAPGGVSTNPGAVDDFQNKARAAATGWANGASSGFGDNMAAAISGVGSMARGQGFQRGYDDSLDIVREGMAADRRDNPKMYNIGNLAGQAQQAILAAPFATGASGLGTVGRSGLIGSIEGALQAGGNADGQDVGREMGRGGMVGAGIGISAPVAVGAAGAVKNWVKDPAMGVVDAALNRANTGKVNRAVVDALRASRKTPDDVGNAVMRAAQEGQPEYRMMDALGVPGQRQASGLTRSGGDAATEMAEFLQRRQADQGDRVGGFIDEAFGTTGTTAAKTRNALTQTRDTTADAAYDAARGNSAPVDVRSALDVIDARIGGMQGSGISGDSIDSKLAGYRSRLAGDGAGLGDDVSSAELSDFSRVLGVKQSIQDDIGAAIRAGRNNEARELGNLVRELDGALEVASDMYRTANDGFREATRVIDSVDEGRFMSSRGRAADNVPAFDAMTPDQQGAARIGYGDNLLEKLEGVTSPTSNRAKPLQSSKRQNEADAITLDPRLYNDRLERENAMWETQNRALGGSRTADNLADQEALDGLAGGTLAAARSGANFQFGDMVSQIASTLGPIAKGQNEATRELIARALLSNDPQAVLAPALRQEMMGKNSRRILEALIRQPAQNASRQ